LITFTGLFCPGLRLYLIRVTRYGYVYCCSFLFTFSFTFGYFVCTRLILLRCLYLRLLYVWLLAAVDWVGYVAFMVVVALFVRLLFDFHIRCLPHVYVGSRCPVLRVGLFGFVALVGCRL